MTTLVLIETVLLAVLTVLVAGLLRAYASLLARLHRLDGGGDDAAVGPAIAPQPSHRPIARFGPAHDVIGETLDGQVVHARTTEVDHDSLLLFLSSGCASCATFWEELRRPVALPAGTRMLVVAQSAADESISDLARIAPGGIDVVLSSQAWRDYEVPGSPHAVLVDGRAGQVRGEGTGQSLRQVTALLRRTSGDAQSLGGIDLRKSTRDLRDEAEVDHALLAAGILPGDPQLYGGDA